MSAKKSANNSALTTPSPSRSVTRGVKPGTKRGPYRKPSESKLNHISKRPAHKPKGANSYKPSNEDRKDVLEMTANGLPHASIARILRVSVVTLKKFFSEELSTALDVKNHEMAQSLYKSGKRGNVSAQIFWLKSRARWRENQPPVLPDTSSPGYDYNLLTTEELIEMRRLAEKMKVAAPAGVPVRQLNDGTEDFLSL